MYIKYINNVLTENRKFVPLYCNKVASDNRLVGLSKKPHDNLKYYFKIRLLS